MKYVSTQDLFATVSYHGDVNQALIVWNSTIQSSMCYCKIYSVNLND